MRPAESALTRSMLVLTAASAVAFAVAACGRAERPRHVRTEPAADLPGDVEFYPHVLYGGDDTYLVDGKWYRPAVDGWVVFTEEPLELEMLRRALER